MNPQHPVTKPFCLDNKLSGKSEKSVVVLAASLKELRTLTKISCSQGTGTTESQVLYKTEAIFFYILTKHNCKRSVFSLSDVMQLKLGFSLS